MQVMKRALAGLCHEKAVVGATVLNLAVVASATVRELVVATVFGVSRELDTYLVASAIPLALVSLVGSTIRASATPHLILTPRRDSSATIKHRWERAVAGIAAAITVIGGLAIAILASGSSHTATVAARTGRTEVALILIATALGVLTSGQEARLLALGRPLWVAFVPSLIHIGILFGAVIGGPASESLFTGHLAGALGAFLVVRAISSKSRLAHLDTPSLRRIWENARVIVGGALAMALTIPIDLFIAAQEPGGASVVNYGTRVTVAGWAVGAGVISSAIYSELARLAHNGEFSQFASTVTRWIRNTTVGGSLLAILLILSTNTIVSLIFGNGLNPHEVSDVAAIQRLSLLSLPFFLVAVLVSRALNALSSNRPVLVAGILGLTVNLCGDLILYQSLGLRGIALATGLTYVTTAFVLCVAYSRIMASLTTKTKTPRL